MKNSTSDIHEVIRPLLFEPDIDRVIDIWYQGSILAHSFVDEKYWLNAKTLMKEVYIPNSKTWVLLADNIIIGFYSIAEDSLAAIFIDPKFHGKGYGRILLQHAFAHNQTLQLHVYQKNNKAVNFYRANEFYIESECVDDNTGESEYIMRWNREE
ncbi:MAG: N-acetyltransferase [Gammaproteobacteria bacterium]